MAAKVFISYRRGDSAGYAGRVRDRLDHELGRALLRRLEGFEQVHHIAHFPKVIGPIASHEDYEIAP